jgi:preprotein translocase subunit SecE
MAENEVIIDVKEEEVKTSKETEKKVKVSKEKQNKKKKERQPSKMGKRMKETASELKKVTWPTFGSVVKKTSVVLAVVLIFAVVLFGIDRLLAWIFSLLVK